MRIFGLEIWDDESQHTTFYTIRKDQAIVSETDAFFVRYEADAAYVDQARMLATLLLDVMGEREGARKEFFRFEGAVDGLPPEPRHARRLAIDVAGFQLRLYCVRLSDHLVILMNGGVKTARTAQESEGLSRTFAEATIFAKAIDKALRDKLITVDATGRYLEGEADEICIFY